MIHDEINPPAEDKVLAKPIIVPAKFGAISKPLLKYPAVTPPLQVNAIVKITTDHTLSWPKNT